MSFQSHGAFGMCHFSESHFLMWNLLPRRFICHLTSTPFDQPPHSHSPCRMAMAVASIASISSSSFCKFFLFHPGWYPDSSTSTSSTSGCAACWTSEVFIRSSGLLGSRWRAAGRGGLRDMEICAVEMEFLKIYYMEIYMVQPKPCFHIHH